MQLIEEKAKFYCREIKKGVELFPEFGEGLKEVIVPGFKAVHYNNSYYLIDDPNGRIDIRKSMLVMTPKGEGTVMEFENVIALVQVLGYKKPETFYIKDLQYTPAEKYLKALENFQIVKERVNKEIFDKNTLAVMDYFEKAVTDVPGGSFMRRTKSDFPKTPPLKFDNPTEDLPPQVKKMADSFGTGTTYSKQIIPTHLHTKDNEGLRTETTSITNRTEKPTKDPVLSHISLNPKSKSDVDKFTFHNKVRGKFEQSNTPPANHPALGGKIYVKGERVNIEGEDGEHDVISHIHPLPTGEHGQPDYSKMLVRNKEGHNIAVDRNKASLVGPDLTKVHNVELSTGKKVPYHNLKVGNNIMKHGIEHKVVATDPHLGIATYAAKRPEGTGIHIQHPDDFDKEFRHEEYDRNKRAEKRDIVEFTYNGTRKKRPVHTVTGR